MDGMMWDVQTLFLLELMHILDQKLAPAPEAEAMLKLAQWYRDELDDVVCYVEEEKAKNKEVAKAPVPVSVNDRR